MRTSLILFALLVLLASPQLFAGLPPTSTRGSNDATDVTTFKFLFPNVTFTHSGTSATFGTVGVASGGTGQTSLTANNVILGNGTSAVQFVAPGASGNMLVSNGTTWTSSAVSGTTLVSTPGVTSPVFYSAQISGTGTVSNEKGDFINGNCSVASGAFTCPVVAGSRTGTLNCSASPAVGGLAYGIENLKDDGTNILVTVYKGSDNTGANVAWQVVCHGNL